MVTASSSHASVSKALTPAKRIGPPVINLEDSFDQNSTTSKKRAVRIKTEKVDESG